MKESQIREHTSKGWIRTIITFEIVGKPAGHVEKALTEYLENIKKDDRIIMLREEHEPAIEHEDGMFSAFCESEMLVKDLETFTWLCINFSPASVEILEPDDLVIEARNLTNWINDLVSRLHEISTGYRTMSAAREHLTIALNELIQNSILLSLRSGEKTAEDISKDSGVYTEQLAPFLKHLTDKGKITVTGKRYTLVTGMKITTLPPKGKVKTTVKRR